MSGICIRCGMLSKSLASNATCPECNANAQHHIGVGEKRMAQAIAELKERNRKQDDDIIDMREAIRKRDAEIAALREAVKDFLCECALVDKFRRYETWQITPWSMDELMKMVEEEP